MTGLATADDRCRRDEAARWFAIQDRGALTLDERAAFERWCEDAANRAALARARDAWTLLEGARGTYRDGAKAAPAPRKAPARAGLRTAAIAASLAAIAGVAALLLRPATAPWQEVRTGIGEQRTLTLEDGSVLHVNVATSLRTRIAGRLREVQLLDGEAEFQVAHDPARPFTVAAAGRRVRVVGTQFDVRSRDGATDVAVREGIVALTQPETKAGEAGPDLLQLRAGEGVQYAGAQVSPVHAVPLDRIGEWRLRVLTYEQASLRDVVRDLRRYFPGQITIADAKLAERRMTLRLPIADREQTLRTLQEILALSIEPVADGIVLRAKPAAAKKS